MPKFGDFLVNWSLMSSIVTRQVTFNKAKIDRKYQNWKVKMRHFEQFSYIVLSSGWNKILNSNLKIRQIEMKSTLLSYNVKKNFTIFSYFSGYPTKYWTGVLCTEIMVFHLGSQQIWPQKIPMRSQNRTCTNDSINCSAHNSLYK